MSTTISSSGDLLVEVRSKWDILLDGYLILATPPSMDTACSEELCIISPGHVLGPKTTSGTVPGCVTPLRLPYPELLAFQELDVLWHTLYVAMLLERPINTQQGLRK